MYFYQNLLRTSTIIINVKLLFLKLFIRFALTNAVRNGKDVTVVLELRARFDEEANLVWKEELEEAGVKVLIGVPNMKVHAKICLIKKKSQNKIIHYGFVSTGNLNESTAKIYDGLNRFNKFFIFRHHTEYASNKSAFFIL